MIREVLLSTLILLIRQKKILIMVRTERSHEERGRGGVVVCMCETVEYERGG